jgi:curved DNA-binding protein CbpA
VDPYEILQVDPRADVEVVKAAYRVLARRHHPDTGGDPARMAELNEAWAIVGDRLRRARFDAGRRRARARDAAFEAMTRATAADTSDPMPVMRTDREGSSGRTSPDARGSWAASPSRAERFASRGDGPVLDFGRYVGWSIPELSRHDPDYLLWLERTPAGRGYRSDIQRALAERERPLATMTRPSGGDRPKRSWFR